MQQMSWRGCFLLPAWRVDSLPWNFQRVLRGEITHVCSAIYRGPHFTPFISVSIPLCRDHIQSITSSSFCAVFFWYVISPKWFEKVKGCYYPSLIGKGLWSQDMPKVGSITGPQLPVTVSWTNVPHQVGSSYVFRISQVNNINPKRKH